MSHGISTPVEAAGVEVAVRTMFMVIPQGPVRRLDGADRTRGTEPQLLTVTSLRLMARSSVPR